MIDHKNVWIRGKGKDFLFNLQYFVQKNKYFRWRT